MQVEDEEEQFSETESPTHLRQLLAAELGDGAVLQQERGGANKTGRTGKITISKLGLHI